MRGLLKTALVLAPVLLLAQIITLDLSSRKAEHVNRLDSRGLDVLDMDDSKSAAHLSYNISNGFESPDSNVDERLGNVTVNDIVLSQESRGNSATSGSIGTSSGQIVIANWNFQCVVEHGKPIAQRLVFNIDYVDGQAVEDAGFSVAFNQIRDDYRIFAIEDNAVKDEEGAHYRIILSQLTADLETLEPSYERELLHLDFLKAQLVALKHDIKEKERLLFDVQGFNGQDRRCDSFQCLLRTIYEKVSIMCRIAYQNAREATQGAYYQVVGEPTNAWSFNYHSRPHWPGDLHGHHPHEPHHHHPRPPPPPPPFSHPPHPPHRRPRHPGHNDTDCPGNGRHPPMHHYPPPPNWDHHPPPPPPPPEHDGPPSPPHHLGEHMVPPPPGSDRPSQSPLRFSIHPPPKVSTTQEEKVPMYALDDDSENHHEHPPHGPPPPPPPSHEPIDNDDSDDEVVPHPDDEWDEHHPPHPPFYDDYYQHHRRAIRTASVFATGFLVALALLLLLARRRCSSARRPCNCTSTQGDYHSIACRGRNNNNNNNNSNSNGLLRSVLHRLTHCSTHGRVGGGSSGSGDDDGCDEKHALASAQEAVLADAMEREICELQHAASVVDSMIAAEEGRFVRHCPPRESGTATAAATTTTDPASSAAAGGVDGGGGPGHDHCHPTDHHHDVQGMPPDYRHGSGAGQRQLLQLWSPPPPSYEQHETPLPDEGPLVADGFRYVPAGARTPSPSVSAVSKGESLDSVLGDVKR